MSKVTPALYDHRPMFVRRFIVMLALAAAYGVTYFSDTLMLTVAAYFVLVTVLDALAFYVLRIKSSDYAGAEQMMADDQTTLEGLDKYASDRRNIRMGSLIIGLTAGGLAFLVTPDYLISTFCTCFFVSTIVGLAILKPHYRKKYPIIIKRNDRFYNPDSGLRPGHITPAMASLAMEGKWPWGHIQY